MKEFLVLIVFIWTIQAQELRESKAATNTFYPPKAKEVNVGSERFTRDVSHLGETQAYPEPIKDKTIGEVNSKIPDDLERAKSPEAIPDDILPPLIIKDDPELFAPYSSALPENSDIEPSTQIQQCEVQSQRSVRDVQNLTEGGIPNFSLIKGVLNCLTTITEEELKKDAISSTPVHHTPEEIAEEIIELAEQHHLQEEGEVAEYIEKAVNSSDEASDVIEEIPNPHVTQHKDEAGKDVVDKLEKQKPIDVENSTRLVRDVSHLFKPRSYLPLLGKPRKEEETPAVASNPSVSKPKRSSRDVIGLLGIPITNKEDNPINPTRQARQSSNKHRTARDVSELFGIFTTEASQLKDQLKLEAPNHPSYSGNPNTGRQVRDVKHLFATQGSAGSPAKTNSVNKVIVHHGKSNHHTDDLADQIIRKIRDIIHQQDSHDDTEAAQIVEGPEEVQQPISERDAMFVPGMRSRRDVVDIRGEIRHSKFIAKEDVEIKATNSEERLKREVEEKLSESSLPENSINDMLQRTQRSPEAAGQMPSDQIVENDVYVENMVKPHAENPSDFPMKFKRSENLANSIETSENTELFLDGIEIHNPEIVAGTETIKRFTRSSVAEEEYRSSPEDSERLKRSSNINVNDVKGVKQSDHLKNQNYHIDDEVSQRVQRSIESSSNVHSPLEVSTQMHAIEDKIFTTETAEMVTPKPTVKVQTARLPLTVFASKRSNLKRSAKNPPHMAFIEKPKSNKKRY